MASERVRIEDSLGVPTHGGPAHGKRNWRGRAVHEAKRFLGMFLYLWVLLGLFALHESVILARHQIAFTRYGVAFFNAWVLAKVMLVAEDLNIARGLEDRPLVYLVLYKSVIFAIVFMAFALLEGVLMGMWHGQTVAESMSAIAGGTVVGIGSAALIVSFALMPYFAFREIGRVIGRSELRALLFSRRQAPGATDPAPPVADRS
jgi:ABC-type transport system involved in cytochrome c biogenesis permease subunit